MLEAQHENPLKLAWDRVRLRHVIAVRLGIVQWRRGLDNFRASLLREKEGSARRNKRRAQNDDAISHRTAAWACELSCRRCCSCMRRVRPRIRRSGVRQKLVNQPIEFTNPRRLTR